MSKRVFVLFTQVRCHGHRIRPPDGRKLGANLGEEIQNAGNSEERILITAVADKVIDAS